MTNFNYFVVFIYHSVNHKTNSLVKIILRPDLKAFRTLFSNSKISLSTETIFDDATRINKNYFLENNQYLI